MKKVDGLTKKRETIPLYDARVFAGFIGAYYKRYYRIDDYLREAKLEAMRDYQVALPGMSVSEKIFSDHTMSPQDMDISLFEVKNDEFHQTLNMITSHTIEDSIPGRSMRLGVWENNTNSFLGFIRLGSPVINMKPRNEWLGQPLDSSNKRMIDRFNNSAIMGFIIVPVQPFGFNCLGGKLLAAICCSHEVKRMFDEKYGTDICHFETTSLYGSTKAVSQYDGMKPYLRFKGVTDSDFLPMIVGAQWETLHKNFKRVYGAELAPKNATSRKMKIQQKMISLISNTLQAEGHPDEFEKFKRHLSEAKMLTEKKRVYFSDYGYANTQEYLSLKTDILEKKENYARHSLDDVILWWRGKATKRWNDLITQKRLRTKLELWNVNPTEIDIIR